MDSDDQKIAQPFENLFTQNFEKYISINSF